MSRHVKIRYFLSKIVKIRAKSQKNGCKCAESRLHTFSHSGKIIDVCSTSQNSDWATCWSSSVRTYHQEVFIIIFNNSIIIVIIDISCKMWKNSLGIVVALSECTVQGTPTHSWCIYLYNSIAPFYILYASNSDRNFASININSAMEWPCQMTRFFQIFISSTIQDGCQEWCWKIDATSPFDVPAWRIYSRKMQDGGDDVQDHAQIQHHLWHKDDISHNRHNRRWCTLINSVYFSA